MRCSACSDGMFLRGFVGFPDPCFRKACDVQLSFPCHGVATGCSSRSLILITARVLRQGVTTYNLSLLPDARHWRTGTQLVPPNGSGRAFAKPGVGSRRRPSERRNTRIERLRTIPSAKSGGTGPTIELQGSFLPQLRSTIGNNRLYTHM